MIDRKSPTQEAVEGRWRRTGKSQPELEAEDIDFMEKVELPDIHCPVNMDLLETAAKDLISAALAFDACACEFEGNLHYCQEYLEAFYDACEKYRTVTP